MKVFWTLSLFLLLFKSGLFAQSGEVIDWEYEIDLLARELSEKHPDLFFRTDSSWFYSAMHKVAMETQDKTLLQVSIELQQVVAAMGDAQTQINYHFLIEKNKILPFEFYWFQDGIYVLKADKAHEALLGKKLTAINNAPIEVVIDSLATLLVLDNQSVLKNQIPRMLVWFQVLEYFGFVSGKELSLTVLSSNKGEELSSTIYLPVELGEMLAVQPSSLPLGWQDQKAFFRDQYFENEHLYYIQYNRCWSREAEEDYGSGASALFMPSFKEFEKEVYPVLKKKDIHKLVFDIRFNKGGHASQGTEFIRKICKALPKDHGDIFVLVGRKTNAAAIINTVDFMKSEEVVLVGEETSGKPNHFGEVNRFVLPESRLIVSYSTRYFNLLDGDLPTIIPEVLTPLEFNQYMKGIDPAMEAVILSPIP